MKQSFRSASVQSSRLQNSQPLTASSFQRSITLVKSNIIKNTIKSMTQSYFPPAKNEQNLFSMRSILSGKGFRTPQPQKTLLPKITSKIVEKRIPSSETDPWMIVCQNSINQENLQNRSFSAGLKSRKLSSLSPIQKQTPVQPEKTLREMLKQKFEPVLSFYSNDSIDEASDADNSKTTQNLKVEGSRFQKRMTLDSNTSFDTEPTPELELKRSNAKRDFLEINDRFKLEQDIAKYNSIDECQSLIEFYTDTVDGRVSEAVIHRLKHLDMVLQQSMTIPDDQKPIIKENVSKLFKMVQKYFIQQEGKTIIQLFKAKLPNRIQSYYELIENAPQRVMKYDIRIPDLHPNEFANYIKELEAEIKFNIYLLQNIQRKFSERWIQIRTNQIIELEKVLGFVIQKSKNTTEFAQIVKFCDEIRKGVIFTYPGGDFVKNGQSELKRILFQEFETVNKLMKSDTVNIKHQLELKKIINCYNDIQNHVNIDDITDRIRTELQRNISIRKRISQQVGEQIE